MVVREAPESEIRRYIEDSQKGFRKQSFEDIALHASLGKEFKDYKSNVPHVRATKFSNKVLGTEFKEGDTFKYLWLKRYPAYPKQNVVAFEYEKQLPKGILVDWAHMGVVSINGIIEALNL